MNIIDKAIHFATDAHRGQYRKGGKEYYIFHPLEVACIASALTSDESVIAAAALHDTVEDTATSIEDIRREFGSRIAAIVASETENKRNRLPKSETWETRKKETIEKREEIRVITAIRHGPYIRRTGNPPDPGLHPPERLLRAGGRTAPSDG